MPILELASLARVNVDHPSREEWTIPRQNSKYRGQQLSCGVRLLPLKLLVLAGLRP
jgi:hypothetical protein